MKIEGRPELGLEIVIRLNESEARALYALAGYSIECFLETFYEQMGKAYLQPHEKGLRTLFAAIHEAVGGILNRMTDCRRVWDGTYSTVKTPTKPVDLDPRVL